MTAPMPPLHEASVLAMSIAPLEMNWAVETWPPVMDSVPAIRMSSLSVRFPRLVKS